MHRARPVAWLLVVGLLIQASAAHAVRGPSSPRTPAFGMPDVPMDARRQVELAGSPVWQAFQARHGAWRAVWNERTGSPRLAVGPSIALPGFAERPDAVDRAVRAFVGSQPELLGAPDLETLRTTRAGRVWYVSYRQRVGGIPLLFDEWEFRVSEHGRLMAFRTDAHRVGEVETRPLVVAAAAREAARASLPFNPSTDTVEGGEALYLFPQPAGDRTEYRLVRDVRVRTASPPGHWAVLVDARSGDVVWRHDRVRYQFSGTVTGQVHPDLPTDALVTRNFPAEVVKLGADSAFTGSSGAYSSSASGTLTVAMELRGKYVNVNHGAGPDAFVTSAATSPAVVDQAWAPGNSLDAERDGYYHVNVVHDWVKALDPGFTRNDFSMPCLVEIPPWSCNAWWDGDGINFYGAGDGCPSMATLPDVVYHEYGHAVNDNLYIQQGLLSGMTNAALHEGLADVLAAFIQDNPAMGKGFLGLGTALRTIDNTLRWPDDQSGDPHETGLIVGGALWDLREALGLPLASQLFHFARYGLPDGTDGEAMSEFFVETLVADDNDGNLANGTPHDAAIVSAFNAHGIGTEYFLQISHYPLDDQTGASPFGLWAVIQSLSPIGGLDPASLRVFYSVNGSPYGSVPMTPTGSSNEFEASIPAPQSTLVRYYLSASDTYGATITHPKEPAFKTHAFLAGATSTYLLLDHENDAGWTVGFPGDGAITGHWIWADPEGSFSLGQPVQPEDDHSQFGFFCYVTGNADAGTLPGLNDVDDGATTVVTYLIDATSAGPEPLIEYYRWFSNDLGNSPRDDRWRAFITGDGGGTWVEIENTTEPDNSWRRIVFFVRDYVTPSDIVKLRFTAEDINNPSLVEAALDDLRLLSFNTNPLAVEPGAVSPARLGAAAPNPFTRSTRLDFALSAAGPVSLRLYDVSGRRVRVLVDAVMAAGAHAISWDGLGEDGRQVPSGLYLARLVAADREIVGRIVRAR